MINYKIKYIHEERSCTFSLVAAGFNIVGIIAVFYDLNSISTYAFNNIVSIEKIEKKEKVK